MAREIPSTAVQIQTGLYQELVVTNFNTYSRLYSSEGYCFYDKNDEIYDEEGNLIPDEQVLPHQRVYAQYMVTPETLADEINTHIVSVPVDPSYEIVSVGNKEEVA